MTIPAILFGIILSSTYGTAFHFFKGGSWRKLLLFVVIAWVGFWSGHFIGEALGSKFALIGALQAGLGTVGSLLFLFVGEWLSRVEPDRSKQN